MSFSEWCEKSGIEYPQGNEIPYEWFEERNLPMIVECTCCHTTICLPNAHIDENDFVYCGDCF